MNPIFKTIAKDIIVLSAQAVAYRLAAPQDQQQDVVFAAVPTKGMPQAKAITDENEPRAQRIGF
jgi:phospholipid N-methyltransferase